MHQIFQNNNNVPSRKIIVLNWPQLPPRTLQDISDQVFSLQSTITCNIQLHPWKWQNISDQVFSVFIRLDGSFGEHVT